LGGVAMQFSEFDPLSGEGDLNESVQYRVDASSDYPEFYDDETDEEVHDQHSVTLLDKARNAPTGFVSSRNQSLPDMVKQFITYFYRHIKEGNLYDINTMYETSFNKITEKYYKQSPWPAPETISALVNHDLVFLMLYKELYYRHIYSKMVPTVEQRFDSWKNYCDLFVYLLSAQSPSEVHLELPSQWLWDMIDEFIYQFQAFCQYRSKLKNKPQEEIIALKANSQVWNVNSVINYLQSLANKSAILQFLAKEKRAEDSGAFYQHNTYKMIGYYSIIGLLRVHCLLGDYYLALSTIQMIDLNAKGLFTQVTSCHITLYYYLGFVYMMIRRYPDAIKAFSGILLYITRTKQHHSRALQFEQIIKKNEQMYGLLAICLSLCPQRVDENVHGLLRDKYSDKMQRMQRGDEACFEELFCYACPKFISPASPNYAAYLEDPQKYPLQNVNQEPLQLQTRLFLNEVKQQALLPTIRSYLKLYTTIGAKKLADFLEIDENNLRVQLLCYKHKTRGLIWNGGSAIGGELSSFSDIDFFVDKDMVHIYDSKSQRRYAEFFIRHINKFEEIVNSLNPSPVVV